MYNQTGNLYNNAFECLWKTVRTEGPLAIYKGFFAHLARILPHTVRSPLVSFSKRNFNLTVLQILTLSLAEQTNKIMRRIEDRVLTRDLKEKI